jgi:hypothetical protein
MTLEQFNIALQIVASIGVIVSLIFVGLQVFHRRQGLSAMEG